MRWSFKPVPVPKVGDLRTKVVFLWWPRSEYITSTSMQTQRRWLEYAGLYQVYQRHYGWETLAWAPDGEGV